MFQSRMVALLRRSRTPLLSRIAGEAGIAFKASSPSIAGREISRRCSSHLFNRFVHKGFYPPPQRNASTASTLLSSTEAAASSGLTMLVTKGVSAQRQVGSWLFCCAGWVFSMVVLGGITRLTRSGLSMTDWKFTGRLPPLSQEEWEAEFEKYKQTPEYRKVHRGMTVENFKFIYWMEYAHRMWGRALGLVFALPCTYFLAKGYITRQLGLRLSCLFGLGAGQGFVGWWMVKSGLEEPVSEYVEPRVSAYRLAAHLTSAFVIYCGLMWTGLSVFMPQPPTRSMKWVQGAAKVRRFFLPVSILVGVTAISGAFVAGNDAGRAFNTFPKMGDTWIPDDIFDLKPLFRNFFENTSMVQLNHRILATATLAAVGAMWFMTRKLDIHPGIRSLIGSTMGMACLQEFTADVSAEGSLSKLKDESEIVHLDNSAASQWRPKYKPVATVAGVGYLGEHKARVLSAAAEGLQSVWTSDINENQFKQVSGLGHKNPHIEQVTDRSHSAKGEVVQTFNTGGEHNTVFPSGSNQHKTVLDGKIKEARSRMPPKKTEANNLEKPARKRSLKAMNEKQSNPPSVLDARVRLMKDQLIRARVYLNFVSIRNNPHFMRELRLRMKEVQRALGDARKDSELRRNAYEKLKAMELTLSKGKQIQADCFAFAKKLRAMVSSSEDQLRAHRKQAMFLTQLSAKTLPKGLHCLPLRLTAEFYALNSNQREVNQQNLQDPSLYHYALFSDNVLAAAVVVNSTTSNAKEPEKHVFHVVTDKLNFAAMKMWFLANPPGNATIEIQNVDNFAWLNSSYSPIIKQLSSSTMVDYYFKTDRANSDPNTKYRNPKYLSVLNHLRFYLPEIFPNLQKVLFLDDDTVVQKDLTPLWKIDLKGMVNGAVETCQGSFHRFDRYLNFSNPLIAKDFDPRACGWAYGMNIFDLREWRKQNITELYHSWQNLNQDRQLWRLGTLPLGLITFWKKTFALNKSWHVLGLGYNPTIEQREIERAAVIHYNGNMKP